MAYSKVKSCLFFSSKSRRITPGYPERGIDDPTADENLIYDNER